MPKNDIADGASNTILIGEGEQAGEAPPPLTETRPRDDHPVDETSPDDSRPDDGTTSPNWDEAPSGRRLERAEGDSDDAGLPPADDSAAPPPDVPEAGEVFDPNVEGVVGGSTEPDGQQQFLVDTDNDGQLDTLVDAVPVGDGTFKVVESSPLDEPLSPEDLPREAGTGTPEINDDDADEAGAPDLPKGEDGGTPPLIDEDPDVPDDGELEIIEPKESAVDAGGPPNVFRPGEAPTEGEHGSDTDEIDLSERFENPPAFGSGAAGDDYAASTAESAEPSIPGDDPGVDVPEVPTGGYEPPLDDVSHEPRDAAESDGSDTGLLEQVAEAVGDLWDDATDLVT
jgi:hypothetical protein